MYPIIYDAVVSEKTAQWDHVHIFKYHYGGKIKGAKMSRICNSGNFQQDLGQKIPTQLGWPRRL
jgi:hypothetical protein